MMTDFLILFINLHFFSSKNTYNETFKNIFLYKKIISKLNIAKFWKIEMCLLNILS